MLLKSYERGNHGHNPAINEFGVGYCQNCGSYATLYPFMRTPLDRMRIAPWFCGSCKARYHYIHASAVAQLAPLEHARGKLTIRSRDGRNYQVIG